MANNTTGLTRIIKAAGYSWKGFRAAWINEAAFRQEGIAAIVAVAIACWLDVDAITRVLLIGSVLIVMIVEILNSAIEAVVDRIGPEHHELSGRAKDMGSAAVLLAIVIALITWASYCGPAITERPLCEMSRLAMSSRRSGDPDGFCPAGDNHPGAMGYRGRKMERIS
jgi:diacylglycerol kinase (ATP)